MEEGHGHSYRLTPSGMARRKASHLDLGDVNADVSVEMRQRSSEQPPGAVGGHQGMRTVSRLMTTWSRPSGGPVGSMLHDMALGAGDFAFGIRYGALDATAAAAKADSDGHHRFPYAPSPPRLASGGRWTLDLRREDEQFWEAFCAQCGDTDGPAENQTEPVQRLRGPYHDEHKAKRAATKHLNEN